MFFSNKYSRSNLVPTIQTRNIYLRRRFGFLQVSFPTLRWILSQLWYASINSSRPIIEFCSGVRKGGGLGVKTPPCRLEMQWKLIFFKMIRLLFAPPSSLHKFATFRLLHPTFLFDLEILWLWCNNSGRLLLRYVAWTAFLSFLLLWSNK